jgi:hypothetical protein
VQIAGVDQGWKVTASPPKIQNLLKVDRTVELRPDPTMPVGQELWVETAQDGFDVTIERTVTKRDALVDHYVYTNHYEPAHNVKVVGGLGATPGPGTSTPTGTVGPSASATASSGAGPAASATSISAIGPVASATASSVSPTPTPATSPAATVRVPSLVGLPEAQARQTIAGLGLQNTWTNYQGPGQVPDSALRSVAAGSVLSQIPPPGAMVAPGTTVYLAVRKS